MSFTLRPAKKIDFAGRMVKPDYPVVGFYLATCKQKTCEKYDSNEKWKIIHAIICNLFLGFSLFIVRLG